MRATRVALISLMLTAFMGVTATPASASCYPQKPQTCQTCHLEDLYIDESGNVVVVWQCP